MISAAVIVGVLQPLLCSAGHTWFQYNGSYYGVSDAQSDWYDSDQYKPCEAEGTAPLDPIPADLAAWAGASGGSVNPSNTNYWVGGSPRSSALLECKFETQDTFCSSLTIVSGANAKWERATGSTPSVDTGPNNAPEGSYYALFETSPVAIGDSTSLLTQTFNNVSSQMFCITFYYHMYGAYMGSMTLSAIDGNTGQTLATLFTKSGNQGNQWLSQEVEYFVPATTNIRFEWKAIRGNDWASDMGLDDVTIRHGQCSQTPTPDCPTLVGHIPCTSPNAYHLCIGTPYSQLSYVPRSSTSAQPGFSLVNDGTTTCQAFPGRGSPPTRLQSTVAESWTAETAQIVITGHHVGCHKDSSEKFYMMPLNYTITTMAAHRVMKRCTLDAATMTGTLETCTFSCYMVHFGGSHPEWELCTLQVKGIGVCLSFPCLNGARCINSGGSYKCVCIAGFTGNHCETAYP